MTRLLLTFVGCLLAAPLVAQPATPPALTTLSFNIRFNNPNDAPHDWPNRKDRVASIFRFYDADLVGLQEALRDQIDDLATALPDYAWVGVGRDDGENAGEFSPIFYRKDRLLLHESGTFWLSQTPDVVASKDWDAAITRIVTWARFTDQATNTTFYHFNTHFDHRGAQARLESAKLIRTQITERVGELPVVLTGDFNIEESAPPYAILVADQPDTLRLYDTFYTSQQPPHGPGSTYFGGFTVTDQPGRRIDYIFVTEGIAVQRYGVLSESTNGAYPSDHLPVLAEITFER